LLDLVEKGCGISGRYFGFGAQGLTVFGVNPHVFEIRRSVDCVVPPGLVIVFVLSQHCAPRRAEVLGYSAVRLRRVRCAGFNVFGGMKCWAIQRCACGACVSEIAELAGASSCYSLQE
jgi:hypothetical protein